MGVQKLTGTVRARPRFRRAIGEKTIRGRSQTFCGEPAVDIQPRLAVAVRRSTQRMKLVVRIPEGYKG